MVLLQGLLINLLFIILLVLFYSMVLWNKQYLLRFKYHKLHLAVIASILIFVSLLLNIRLEDNFVYDLRFIPFLLGSLYGGKIVAAGLSGLLILLRFPIGGDGVWVSLVLVMVSSIAIIWIYPVFKRKPTIWRLYFTTALSLIYSVIAFLIPSLLYGFYDFLNFIVYTCVLTTSTFFVTYLAEFLRTAYLLQLEAIKYKKMEIVSHLAASISHEVRNPLTAVRGFLQLILEHKETSEAPKTYASLALDETIRATEIIDDYLTFAKPHPDVVITLDLEKEIGKCKEIISPLALKNNIHMNVVYFHTKKMSGDPNKFRQVLLNICKNSIEAMSKGGTLSIVTSTNAGKNLIHVTDTGHGMSQEHLARLGEPYFSLKEQKGTGLGMMVVFRLVEGMGGTVKITSEEFVGTSITLSFPTLNYDDNKKTPTYNLL